MAVTSYSTCGPRPGAYRITSWKTPPDSGSSEPMPTVRTASRCRSLEYADIARLLDVPLGTVKARIHHARRYVRQALAGGAPAREGRPSMP